MGEPDKSDLNRALPIFIGVDFGSWPRPDFSRVVVAMGHARASAVEASVLAVRKALFQVEPDWSAHTLVEASDHAVAQVRAIYPELDEEAGDALFWDYSWAYK